MVRQLHQLHRLVRRHGPIKGRRAFFYRLRNEHAGAVRQQRALDQPDFEHALRYSGKLTYAANWGAIDQNVGGYQNVPWWNQLDYIGIDAYFPIASQNNTTLAGLTAAWQNQANSIESWRASRAAYK